MQILPSILEKAKQDYQSYGADQLAAHTSSAALFADFMNNHMEVMAKQNEAMSMFAGKAAEQRTTLDEQVSLATKAVAPARRAAESAPQNIKVSREDFQDMKEGLKEYGLSDQEISELEDKVNSDGGITWGQMVRELAGKVAEQATTKVEFTAEQKQELNSFFAKLGFDTKKAKELVAKLSQGKHEQVFAAVQEKLAEYPFDKVFPFTAKEVGTFAKALGLGNEATTKLQKMLAGGQEFTPEQMKGVMSAIKQEMATLAQQKQEKTDKLGEMVGKTLKTAQDKAEIQGLSDRRGQVPQEKVLEDSAGINKEIKESVEIKNQQGSEATQSVKEKFLQDKQVDKNAGQAMGEDKKQAVAEGNDQPAKNAPRENKSSKTGEKVMEKAAEALRPGNGDDSNPKGAQDFFSGQDMTKEERDAWGSFLDKVRLGAGTTATSGSKASAKIEEVLAQATQALKNQGGANGAKASKATENFSMRRTMEQVKDAVFKNSGQGSKQLNLQLKPEHLGKLNIVLQVKNNEVRALIRAENPETGRMLADQVQALKDSLEQQGLKVEKVEVQTNLADTESQLAWQNADSHNQAREREELARWRSQFRSMGSESGEVAQEMQSPDYREISSPQGLHLIA